MIQSLNPHAGAGAGAGAELQSDSEKPVNPAPGAAKAPGPTPAEGKRPKKVSRSRARHYARGRAMQALYQRELNGLSLIDIERQFFEDQDMQKVDMAFFLELLHKVPANMAELDQQLAPCLDVPVEQLDPVERSILRMACYELMQRPDVPWKVVLNEAVELAKTFGAEQGHRFVNGVLDKLGRKLRATGKGI